MLLPGLDTYACLRNEKLAVDVLVRRAPLVGPTGSAALFRLSAHDKPTCTLSFCPAVRGLLATGSTDKKVGGAGRGGAGRAADEGMRACVMGGGRGREVRSGAGGQEGTWWRAGTRLRGLAEPLASRCTRVVAVSVMAT